MANPASQSHDDTPQRRRFGGTRCIPARHLPRLGRETHFCGRGVGSQMGCQIQVLRQPREGESTPWKVARVIKMTRAPPVHTVLCTSDRLPQTVTYPCGACTGGRSGLCSNRARTCIYSQ